MKINHDVKKRQVHFGFLVRKETVFNALKKILNLKIIKKVVYKNFNISKTIWFTIDKDKTILEAKIYNYKTNDSPVFHIGIHVKNIFYFHQLHLKRINRFRLKKIVEIEEILYNKHYANYFIIFDKQIFIEVIEYFSNNFS